MVFSYQNINVGDAYTDAGATATDNIDGNDTDFDSNNNLWFVLGAGVIRGWTYGVTNIKAGVNATMPNEPLTFDGTGKSNSLVQIRVSYQKLF